MRKRDARRAGPHLWRPGAPRKPRRPDDKLDEFDYLLRNSIVAAFAGGTLAHLLVALFVPEHALGGFVSAALIALGFGSAVLIPLLPWQRYGRDLFAGILLYAAVLIAGLVYATGGPASPFGVAFLLIATSAGLYHPARLAWLVTGACALLGFAPYLYTTPGKEFLLQQVILSVSVVTIVAFQRLVIPEILRRARAEQGLKDDLRETRQLRDELARANTRLERQARTDALTGLLNHGAIVAHADEVIGGDPACALLFFDIDHFKRINDHYGHPAGDAVLGEMAQVARGVLRPGDALGRYGGEEFLAVLPETDRATAAALAEALRAAVARHPFPRPDGGRTPVTISVGVATAGAEGATRQLLLQTADAALYRAKEGGRDRAADAVAPAQGQNEPTWLPAEAGEELNQAVRA